MVTNLMISAKMAAPDLLKIEVFERTAMKS